MEKRTLSPAARIPRQPADSVMSDEGLFAMAKGGAHDAFEELYERYFKRLFALIDSRLRKYKVPCDKVADALQEAFLVVWGSFDARKGSFKAFLYHVAVNKAVDLYRTQKTRMEYSLDTPLSADEDLNLIETLVDEDSSSEAGDGITDLRRCLPQLSPKIGMALILHYIEGFSLKEIAGMCKCPWRTVGSRLRIGREKLYASLAGESSGKRCQRRPQRTRTCARRRIGCRTVADISNVPQPVTVAPAQRSVRQHNLIRQ